MPEIGKLRREEAFAVLREIIHRKFAHDFGGDLTARFVIGYVGLSDKKNQYKATLLTELEDKYDGIVGHNKDAQSGLLDDDAVQPAAEPNSSDVDDLPSTSTLWKQVRDETESVQHRLEAIHKLLASQKDQALEYVAAEFARENSVEDWIIALVFLTEDVHFPPELRSSVRDSLLRIALAFRKSTKAGAERVVWAAVRRMSSLCAPQQAIALVPFLQRDDVVDARAVALKCVERLFFIAPPDDHRLLRPIGDRAHTLAEKFLDRDIFAGGEYALLAQSAICTLAAIGDDRLGDAVARATSLKKRWLTHQLRTRLDALRTSWRSHGNDIVSSAAYRNLEAELTKLS